MDTLNRQFAPLDVWPSPVRACGPSRTPSDALAWQRGGQIVVDSVLSPAPNYRATQPCPPEPCWAQTGQLQEVDFSEAVTKIFSGEGEPITVTPAPDETKPPGMPADGFPASPPLRLENWDFKASTYKLASGDTLSGLARLYLGDPRRYTEIVALNRAKVDNRGWVLGGPGTALLMPKEATDRAAELGRALPGGPTSSTTGEKVKVPWSKGKKLAVGGAVAGGVAAVGVGIWAVSRKAAP
jgi:hypothetical protein